MNSRPGGGLLFQAVQKPLAHQGVKHPEGDRFTPISTQKKQLLHPPTWQLLRPHKAAMREDDPQDQGRQGETHHDWNEDATDAIGKLLGVWEADHSVKSIW